jgi:hypothetical protein
VIGNPPQQALFGARIMGDIEELLDVRCYRLATAGTIDSGLGHEVLYL